MRLLNLSIVLTLTALPCAAGELAAPRPILAGGRPLDVEHMGYAAPFVADFDRDGVKDLLVGEFYQGRLRIYRNLGANEEPQFESFTLFQDGHKAGRIHASCCMGFSPQCIDFDGDGHRDVISGNWVHEVMSFRGRADGSFSTGEPIKSRNNRPINIGYGVAAFAVDWDADGDLDLLAGTVEQSEQGNVFLVRNEGTRQKDAFEKPENLLADGKPIVDPDGGASPVAADWDGDGKFDLILGCGDGSVRWYRNEGKPDAPALTSFINLVEAPAKDEERGQRAKPCVTDWNEDGQLDLLVGDVGERFEKQWSPDELLWREDAIDQQEAYLKEWAKVFAHYRELAARTSKAGEGNQDDLAKTRSNLARLSSIRTQYCEKEASLQAGLQTHGRVWLFLNESARSQNVAAD